MFRYYVIPVLLAAVVPQLNCKSPTAENEGLSVSLTLNVATVHVAEQVGVRIAAVNRGIRPITMNANECPYAFTVTDEHGAIAGPESEICALFLDQRELAPGDSLVIEYNWVPRRVAAWPAAPLLGPGGYQLRGRILARGGLVESLPRSLNITP